MCCLKPIVTASLETGAVQADLENDTSSGDGSANVPFIRWPGSEELSAASPAVLTTLAVGGARGRGLPRRADHIGGRGGRVVLVHARGERAERGRGAERQRQRRRN